MRGKRAEFDGQSEQTRESKETRERHYPLLSLRALAYVYPSALYVYQPY